MVKVSLMFLSCKMLMLATLRAQELLKVIKQMREEYSNNNLAVKVLREKIPALLVEVASLEAEKAKLETTKASLHREVKNVRHDKVEVVLKVVPYMEM
nr:hypothetical protein [Tanacetum cinerariifolium]